MNLFYYLYSLKTPIITIDVIKTPAQKIYSWTTIINYLFRNAPRARIDGTQSPTNKA